MSSTKGLAEFSVVAVVVLGDVAILLCTSATATVGCCVLLLLLLATFLLFKLGLLLLSDVILSTLYDAGFSSLMTSGVELLN